MTVEVGPYKYRRWIGRAYWAAVWLGIFAVIVGGFVQSSFRK
jgi:hypothetical protein